MPPWIMALIFGSLALFAGWALVRDIRSGQSGDDIWRFNVDSNPAGYALLLAGKVFVLAYGIATVTWALGLNDNPFLMLKAALGPLAP
jgi:hypothetical protein